MLTFGQRKTCILPNAYLRLLHDLALGSCGSSMIEYFGSLLMMRILVVAHLVAVLPLVVPPYFAKLIDLGLTGSSLLDLFLLLQHFKVNHQ